MSADLIILTGPPGAGKTTVAAQVARAFPLGVHLHTDDFWHAIVAGAIAPYEIAADAQNHTVLDVVVAAAFAYADGGFTTVVDGIVGPWMLGHVYARMLRSSSVSVHYLVLRPDRDITIARARDRVAASALTDPGPVTAMWDQFADLGALGHHAVDTSSDGPADTIARVMAAVESDRYLLSNA